MAKAKRKVKHPDTGEETEVDDETNVETQKADRSPEQEQLDAAADQRSATGGQSGFGSNVPAKMAEEHGVDEDTGNPNHPRTKDESEKLARKRDKDKD